MAKPPAVADLLPRWTKRVVTDATGRDPLGLSRVSDSLTAMLVPGITTQTGRARYFALYTWILWHIEHEEAPKTSEAFVEAFQRREAAIALATLMHDADASPVGKRATERRLEAAKPTAEVNTAFRVLPSDQLGGYGQYYGGSLYALGLTHRPDGAVGDLVPSGVPTRLAEAVHATINATPYVTGRYFQNAIAPLDVLERSGARLSIEAVRETFASHEQALLVDLFFGFPDDVVTGSATAWRRASLARVLHAVDAYERAGAPVSTERETLDLQLVYGPTYFGVLASGEGTLASFECPPELEACHVLWRQFALHEYLTVALEWMLCCVLDVIAADTNGKTVDDIVEELLAGELEAWLADVVGTECPTPSSMLRALGLEDVPDEAASMAFRKRVPYGHEHDEAIVCATGADTPAEVAARACLLLAILYGRWRGIGDDQAWREISRTAGSELAAPNVLPLLDKWFDSSTRWSDVLRTMILGLVIRQHDRVMYSKGRLESCWLHALGDRYVRDQEYEAAFRASRHEQIVRVLSDIGLLSRSEDRMTLTDTGRAVLARALAGLA